MIIRPAKRTESVQEYYFSRKLKEIDRMNAGRKAAGQDGIINLGIGAPDGMPPAEAVKALAEAASMPGNHAYQSYTGIPQLRQAFADWYARYYGVGRETRSSFLIRAILPIRLRRRLRKRSWCLMT